MLFTIRFINPSLMYYFKLQKFEFKQLIDDMTINLYHLEILQVWKIDKDKVI